MMTILMIKKDNDLRMTIYGLTSADVAGPPGTPQLRHPEDSNHVSCSARAGNPPARFNLWLFSTVKTHIMFPTPSKLKILLPG